ncbi:MAG: hypothetical protein Q8L07_15025, partial [Sediminibacterium sp.]|nr:hypothetical protein [Sediminibacterium sp.]
MSENEYKGIIKSMLSLGELAIRNYNGENNTGEDSLHFVYKFNIGDTILNASLFINDDGIYHGKLRVISLRFYSNGVTKPKSNDPSYPSPAEDKVIFEKLQSEGISANRNRKGRIDSIDLPFSKSGYDYLFTFLKKNYGSFDSMYIPIEKCTKFRVKSVPLPELKNPSICLETKWAQNVGSGNKSSDHFT